MQESGPSLEPADSKTSPAAVRSSTPRTRFFLALFTPPYERKFLSVQPWRCLQILLSRVFSLLQQSPSPYWNRLSERSLSLPKLDFVFCLAEVGSKPCFWVWSEPTAGRMTSHKALVSCPDTHEGWVSVWEPLSNFNQEGQKMLLFLKRS